MKNHIEFTHPRLVASKKLQNLQAYDGHHVHNMLAIMLDPHFKSLTMWDMGLAFLLHLDMMQM